jgi:hypothetical protein
VVEHLGELVGEGVDLGVAEVETGEAGHVGDLLAGDLGHGGQC